MKSKKIVLSINIIRNFKENVDDENELIQHLIEKITLTKRNQNEIISQTNRFSIEIENQRQIEFKTSTNQRIKKLKNDLYVNTSSFSTNVDKDYVALIPEKKIQKKNCQAKIQNDENQTKKTRSIDDEIYRKEMRKKLVDNESIDISTKHHKIIVFKMSIFITIFSCQFKKIIVRKRRTICI